jgi:hypothetical protein
LTRAHRRPPCRTIRFAAQRAPSRVDRDAQQRIRVAQGRASDASRRSMRLGGSDSSRFLRARDVRHRRVEQCEANRSRVIRSIPILDGSIEVRFDDVIQNNFSCGFASMIGRFRAIK